MTQQKRENMPDEIWVFSDPLSLGDMRFTQSTPEEGYTKYIRAPQTDQAGDLLCASAGAG